MFIRVAAMPYNCLKKLTNEEVARLLVRELNKYSQARQFGLL